MDKPILESPEQRAINTINQSPKSWTISSDSASIGHAILVGAFVIARAIRGIPDPTLDAALGAPQGEARCADCQQPLVHGLACVAVEHGKFVCIERCWKARNG